MTWQSDARELATLLALEHTPIGISRRDDAPAGVARAGRDLPSACAYWRLGEQQLVFATAEDHRNCPIGMMVMGFEPPPAVASEAQILVGNMAGLGYLDPAEVAHLPMLAGGHAGVLYGPAEQFPEQPEAVLLICTPAQAMVLSEAIGAASLLPDTSTPILGRPACSAIARAVLESGATMSLACKGARVLAELAPGEMLAVVPGDSLAGTVDALRTAVTANAGMEQHYQGRKRTFTRAG
jgi:uncharacterized protein (DUF169 family)